MTSDGQYYHRVRFKQIISEQVAIGYMSKGGVSYSDTDNMTPYERKIAYDTLIEIIQGQANKVQSEMNNQRLNDQRSAPRSGLTG